MCGRRCTLILSLLFLVSSSAQAQSTPSPKQVLLENLLDYQISLEQVKFSIEHSKQTIVLLEQQILTLSDQLESSNVSSTATINNLKFRLKESERLLAISEATLLDQEAQYKQLLTELDHYESLSRLYRNTTIGLSVAVIGLSVVEIGRWKKWW